MSPPVGRTSTEVRRTRLPPTLPGPDPPSPSVTLTRLFPGLCFDIHGSGTKTCLIPSRKGLCRTSQLRERVAASAFHEYLLQVSLYRSPLNIVKFPY